MWGDTIRKGGTCKTHETHETLSMINVYDGPMETAMLVNIRYMLSDLVKKLEK